MSSARWASLAASGLVAWSNRRVAWIWNPVVGPVKRVAGKVNADRVVAPIRRLRVGRIVSPIKRVATRVVVEPLKRVGRRFSSDNHQSPTDAMIDVDGDDSNATQRPCDPPAESNGAEGPEATANQPDATDTMNRNDTHNPTLIVSTETRHGAFTHAALLAMVGAIVAVALVLRLTGEGMVPPGGWLVLIPATLAGGGAAVLGVRPLLMRHERRGAWALSDEVIEFDAVDRAPVFVSFADVQRVGWSPTRIVLETDDAKHVVGSSRLSRADWCELRGAVHERVCDRCDVPQIDTTPLPARAALALIGRIATPLLLGLFLVRSGSLVVPLVATIGTALLLFFTAGGSKMAWHDVAESVVDGVAGHSPVGRIGSIDTLRSA